MLQSMREGAGKWIIWIVIVIVVIALTLWGISYYFIGGNTATPAAAKVNGVKITQTELMAAYNRLRQARPQLFTVADAQQKIKQQLLQGLVRQMILSQAASQQGLAVSEAQLNSVLIQIPAFQINGKFSQAQFSMILNRALFTPQQFMQNIRSTLLINQVSSAIVGSAFALPNENKAYVELLQQKRNIGYLIIPLNHFTGAIKISARQIQDFYINNKDNFKTPEKVSIAYLEMSPKAIAATIKPTQTELRKYYQDNLSNYTTPTSWHVAHILLNIPKDAKTKQINELKGKLAKIHQQIKQGTAFAQLAKQHSDDLLTSTKGGVLPWFTAGTLGPVFEHTVAQLKIGETSLPVQTRYGVELIKLLGKRAKQVKSYQQVQQQVTKAYLAQQLANIIPKENEALANVTFENPNSLMPAAKQLGLKIKTTSLVTRTGLKTGITANANIMATAFSNDVLQQGNNSDVITLKNGTLIVLRIQKHLPAAVKPLTAVEQQIRQQLTQQQAERQAIALGSSLLPQIKTNAIAVAIALKHKLSWITKINITRKNREINPLILQQAFNLSPPVSQRSLTVKGLALANGDYAIVGVSHLILGDTKSISKTQDELLKQQLENNFARATYNSYAKTQQNKAKIKLYADHQ